MPPDWRKPLISPNLAPFQRTAPGLKPWWQVREQVGVSEISDQLAVQGRSGIAARVDFRRVSSDNRGAAVRQ